MVPVEYRNTQLSVENTTHKKTGGLVIIFSGPSGVGKSTIINTLLESSASCCYFQSYTTRTMRDYESPGHPYHFLDEPTFYEMVNSDSFLEYNLVHGNLYGTLRSEYMGAMQEGKIILKDIDVNGADDFRAKFHPDEILSIYLDTRDSHTILTRLTARNENEHAIKKRMNRMSYEAKQKDKYDYQVYNDDIVECVTEVTGIINQHLPTSIPPITLKKGCYKG